MVFFVYGISATIDKEGAAGAAGAAGARGTWRRARAAAPTV